MTQLISYFIQPVTEGDHLRSATSGWHYLPTGAKTLEEMIYVGAHALRKILGR
jgi:hypothetical protein